MALFLLKRCGYDPASMITTINLFSYLQDQNRITPWAKVKSTHPQPEDRVSKLQDNILKFDKIFSSNYEVAPPPSPSAFRRVLMFLHLVFPLCSNKHSTDLYYYYTIHVLLNHYSIIIFFAIKRSPTSSSRSLR